MQKVKKVGLGQNNYKSKLFYTLLVLLPSLQFLLFYVFVNFNSFLLAFKIFPNAVMTEYEFAWDNFSLWFNNAVKNAANIFRCRTAGSSAIKAASPPFTPHAPSAAEKRKKWCRYKMLLIVPQPIAWRAAAVKNVIFACCRPGITKNSRIPGRSAAFVPMKQWMIRRKSGKSFNRSGPIWPGISDLTRDTGSGSISLTSRN